MMDVIKGIVARIATKDVIALSIIWTGCAMFFANREIPEALALAVGGVIYFYFPRTTT